MQEEYYSSKYKSFDTLDSEIDKKVDALWEKFTEYEEAGDLETAEKFALQAWQTLPEPKGSWDYFSNTIPYALTEFYRDQGRYAESTRWLAIARETYGPGRNQTVEFLAATIAFEQGDFDIAYSEFARQHEAFGQAPFRGEDPKYLKFYKANTKARK